ncbi:MAG TPA: Rne/Rng family ribonuclease [Pirellulaceae bacterium]|nr:Rne/Rng family ribonuclease [Pirellulaceae bacterium]HMP69782.1 Rne/Rng family ribonuclease [Pirellulaceae bacterium]
MKKEMLINTSQPEECRIAILEDNRLEELYMERASQDNYAGNIYLGKVVNLEPSIQAVFVNFGVGKNGFLHISDVEPSYYAQGGYDPKAPEFRDDRGRPHRKGNDQRRKHGDWVEIDDDDDVDADRPQNSGRGRRGRSQRQMLSSRPRVKPPIQEIFQRGDDVLVQVIKEGIGNKGPTLSTYISIPGRYLVLMPALARVGVSRKIDDEGERRRLKEILLDLNPPKGLGFIVRTAGQGRSRRDLSRDMAYLLRLWKAIVRRLKSDQSPTPIYEESDLIIRTIRDIVTSDMDSIVIDRKDAYERAREFLKLVMPRQVNRLKYYEGRDPLFHKYSLEDAIAQINRREVPLPEGGSIVIDQTEALVAIDVNSGNFRVDDSAEETAYRLNLAAAKEISRQLRLRDLGGVIVNDFIDMRREKHRRGVEHALRDAMKRDRARTKILRTSPFGLIEMTRQRVRPGVKRSSYRDCPCCSGRGVVKTEESMALDVMRMLLVAAHQPNITTVQVVIKDDVASYLNNQKRKELAELETEGTMRIRIIGRENVYPEHLDVECRDDRDNVIKLPVK